MPATTYRITGMTCDHCVGAVRSQLAELPGVEDVEVDLDRGTATVTAGDVLPLDTVAGAVVEAGYELAGAVTD